VNRNLVRKQRGTGFIEVIIALAILGIVAVVFLGGLGTSLKTVFISDESATALALAQSQMEYVKSKKPYSTAAWSYTITTSPPDSSNPPDGWWDPGNNEPPPLSNDYDGYCAEVKAEDFDVDGDGSDDTGIRRITITVYHNENCTGDIVFTLEDYKLDR